MLLQARRELMFQVWCLVETMIQSDSKPHTVSYGRDEIVGLYFDPEVSTRHIMLQASAGIRYNERSIVAAAFNLHVQGAT